MPQEIPDARLHLKPHQQPALEISQHVSKRNATNNSAATDAYHDPKCAMVTPPPPPPTTRPPPPPPQPPATIDVSATNRAKKPSRPLLLALDGTHKPCRCRWTPGRAHTRATIATHPTHHHTTTPLHTTPPQAATTPHRRASDPYVRLPLPRARLSLLELAADGGAENLCELLGLLVAPLKAAVAELLVA
jgi:hypothetical protein